MSRKMRNDLKSESHLKTYRNEEKFKNNSGKTLNLMWLTKCKVETIKTRQETVSQENLKKKKAFPRFFVTVSKLTSSKKSLQAFTNDLKTKNLFGWFSLISFIN